MVSFKLEAFEMAKTTTLIDALQILLIFCAEQREDDNFIPSELPTSPKYTMSEKWIMDHQKQKHLKDQKWLLKQQKTRHRIATCFYKLKVCA